MSDYLGLTDGKFDNFFKQLNQYSTQKCSGTPPEWPHIPMAELTKLVTAYDQWLAAYTNTLVPHSKVETEAKNEAKDAAKTVIRSFVNRFLREDWDVVTDMDRTEIGIPNRDKIATPHPAPTAKPQTDAVPSGKGKHTVTAINPQSQNKKRPSLVEGVAFAHKVRAESDPKSAPEDMPSVFQTGTSRDFQWPEADYGKVVDYATAYENAGGKRGPWSDVVSVIIA
jgi:hypothetical protein